jgi:hypothetical protein
VLNDRERRVLAHIERDLVRSDPRLARLFQKLAYVRPHSVATVSAFGTASASRRSMRDAGPAPCLLLIGGLLLIVLGGVGAALPVVGTGIVMTLLAFALAIVGSQPHPGTAT